MACADAGAAVTLFEKRKHLGGLTWSFSHDGLSMDNGQHVFLRCCTAYLDFLGRIGSAGDVELQDRLDVTVLTARRRRPGVATAGPGACARSTWPGRSFAIGLIPLGARARFAGAALALARLDLDDPALDEQTFEDWLVRHGQGPAAISALWDLICLPTVNLPASEPRGHGGQGLPDRPSHPEQCRRHRLEPGASRPAPRRASGGRAAQGRRCVPSAEASGRASRGRAGQARRQLVHRPRPPSGELRADGVVVALPHYCTENVLPPGPCPDMSDRRELASSPIVNVHVHFDRRVTDLPLVAGTRDGRRSGFSTAPPRRAPARASTWPYRSRPQTTTSGPAPPTSGAQMTEALRRSFPACQRREGLSTFVTKEHHATFRASPGSSAHRAPTRTLVPGLVLAGAWTATGWPPTMEGAVRSGVSAARAVLVAAGQRSGLPPLSSDRLEPGKLQEVM